jgi:2-polyprenyl-6-methoxyphenol hydroxylase-like FAD-dependent oxidoreductase
MNASSSPVLIVGAGPVGLSAALALTQAGIPVRLIDRLAEPTDQSRAAAVHARTLEHFERLGIVDDFLAAGVRIHGASLFGKGEVLLAHPTLDHLPTHYPFLLGLEQSHTETLLTLRLEALGVGVERRVELLGLAQDADAVHATLRLPDGTETIDDFAYVLGADGGRSATRAALGLHLEGETLDATWLTADVKINWHHRADEAIAYLARDGFAFIMPMNDDRWRVIVNVEKMTPEQAEKVTIEDIQALVLERFDVKAELSDCVWISPFSINTRMTATMRVGRVFLAGDAAHIHSPVGGQGMNTGIQDALNLAWKLALVVQGRAGDALLDTYNHERHGNARHLLSAIGPATRMMNLRQPVAIEIRNLAIRLVNQLGAGHLIARNMSMLTVGYPDSPLAEDLSGHLHGGPRAGERAPDAEGIVIGGRPARRLHAVWAGDARHQLLVFGPHSVGLDFRDLVNVIHLDAATDSEGQAREAYAVPGEGLCLVRPDGYIAFRANSTELDPLRAYLARWYPPAV